MEGLLRAALEDAGVFEDTAVLFLVAGEPPGDASEYAYLPPGAWGNLEARVLRDVGARLGEFSDFHRFGAYANLVAVPEGAIAVGLRHEAEHAVQFNQYGRDLFDLESILRRTMRRAGRMEHYTSTPSEREANRAASEYAHVRYADNIDAMAADERFRHLVEEPQPVANLLDETVATIWEYVDRAATDDEDTNRRSFGVVVPELKQGATEHVPFEPRHRVRRAEGQPFVVEIQP